MEEVAACVQAVVLARQAKVAEDIRAQTLAVPRFIVPQYASPKFLSKQQFMDRLLRHQSLSFAAQLRKAKHGPPPVQSTPDSAIQQLVSEHRMRAQQSIDLMRERRLIQANEWAKQREELKRLMSREILSERMSRAYSEKSQHQRLERDAEILQELRARVKPMQHELLKMHERIYLQRKKEAQSERAKDSPPPRARREEMAQVEKARLLLRRKLQKVREYQSYIKQNFSPAVRPVSRSLPHSEARAAATREDQLFLGNNYMKQVNQSALARSSVAATEPSQVPAERTAPPLRKEVSAEEVRRKKEKYLDSLIAGSSQGGSKLDLLLTQLRGRDQRLEWSQKGEEELLRLKLRVLEAMQANDL